MKSDTLDAMPPSLDHLQKALEPLNLTPGWVERKRPIMIVRDRSTYVPSYWRYQDARAGLEAAGALISVEDADRRNLLLRNPISEAEWETSRTLVCAYQMIMPGEAAPSHRHSSNALRVIIEGEGAYSVVDGIKMPMNAGDVVLTPGGHYHGHGHEGTEPSYWLDCLDIPLTHLLEPMYFEPYPSPNEPIREFVTTSAYRFSAEMIANLVGSAPADQEGARGRRAILPTPSMPTIGLTVEGLSEGQAFRRQRSTANRIYVVMSGQGHTDVGDVAFGWSRGDTFVVPSGYWTGTNAQADSVLLEMSDEPLMRFANHYHQELG